jgi:hypothetical protein
MGMASPASAVTRCSWRPENRPPVVAAACPSASWSARARCPHGARPELDNREDAGHGRAIIALFRVINRYVRNERAIQQLSAEFF